MQKYALLLLFFILFVAQSFGIELSLAPGLSIKNLFLYAMLTLMVVSVSRKNNSQSMQIVHRLSVQEREASITKLHVLFCVLIFYVLISMLSVMAIGAYSSYDHLTSIITFKTNFIDRYLFLLVFFYGLDTLEDCVWLLKCILGITVLGNMVTIVDALDMPDLGIVHQREDGRVSGPMGESNQYGAFLVMFLPITFYMVLISKNIGRTFFFIGSVAGLGVLLLTASRGAVVGLCVSLFFVTVTMWKHLNTKYFLAASIAVLFVCITVVFIVVLQTDGLLAERFVGQSGGYGSDARTISSGRSMIWGDAIIKMSSEPWTFITGFGWASWNVADGLARLYENVTKYNMAPHNSYLPYLFELGVIGLGLFLTIVGWILRYAFDSLGYASKSSKGILIAFCYGFVALLVATFFVDLFKPWLYVWSFVGIALRIAYFSYSGGAESNNNSTEMVSKVKRVKC